MNNYNYPYYGNNYGYGVPQQQPQYYQPQQQYYQQPIQQPQKPKYIPLYFTNGLVGVQSLILDPNEKVYLLDSDNQSLYIKSSDSEGRYTIESFELTKTGTPKESKIDYITRSDFEAFSEQINSSMNKLLTSFEMFQKSKKNNLNER